VLLSLPALQKLEAFGVELSSFAFLSQMPQLCELDFELYGMPPVTRAALLASAAAGHFARINNLALAAADLQSDELSALLSGMPQLTCLKLLYWGRLCSLRSLATAQLAASLTELTLGQCDALPLVELEHIQGLKCLRTLTLWESFTAPLPLGVQRLFTPGDGALLLPQLVKFQYRPPRVVVAAAEQ